MEAKRKKQAIPEIRSPSVREKRKSPLSEMEMGFAFLSILSLLSQAAKQL